MKIEDIAKLVFIFLGKDKNFKFTCNTTDDVTCKYYECTSDDLEISGYGSLDFIINLFKEIRKSKTKSPHLFTLSNESLKNVLNDDYRTTLYDLEEEISKHNKDTKKYQDMITDYIQNNYPCKTCKINKKDFWDTIHYNCELCHTHSCPQLKIYDENYSNFLKEVSNIEEYVKLKENHYQKTEEIYKQLEHIRKQKK